MKIKKYVFKLVSQDSNKKLVFDDFFDFAQWAANDNVFLPLVANTISQIHAVEKRGEHFTVINGGEEYVVTAEQRPFDLNHERGRGYSAIVFDGNKIILKDFAKISLNEMCRILNISLANLSRVLKSGSLIAYDGKPACLINNVSLNRALKQDDLTAYVKLNSLMGLTTDKRTSAGVRRDKSLSKFLKKYKKKLSYGDVLVKRVEWDNFELDSNLAKMRKRALNDKTVAKPIVTSEKEPEEETFDTFSDSAEIKQLNNEVEMLKKQLNISNKQIKKSEAKNKELKEQLAQKKSSGTDNKSISINSTVSESLKRELSKIEPRLQKRLEEKITDKLNSLIKVDDNLIMELVNKSVNAYMKKHKAEIEAKVKDACQQLLGNDISGMANKQVKEAEQVLNNSVENALAKAFASVDI